MNKKFLLFLIGFSFIIFLEGVFALNISLSDQGTDVKNKTSGDVLTSGNLIVSIYDSLTGGNLIYNETFEDAIVNGSWNVMLGENNSNNLSLEYGKIYYKDYAINSLDLDFIDYQGNTVERQFFYSPLGEISDEDISGTTNITTTGWFKGLFNWTISAVSNLWLSFTGSELSFNETKLNETINSSIDVKAGELNVNSSDYLDSYNSSFFMPLNTSVYGNFSFNGGWENEGVSIIDGDIYAQTGYFYNITSLNVTKKNLTIIDNLTIGGHLFSSGIGDNYFMGNLGIGTGSPANHLDIRDAGSGSDVLGNGTFSLGLDNPYWIFRQSATPLSDLIIDRFYSAAHSEVMRIQRSTGNVGIGTVSPGAPLSFADATGNKIFLYGNAPATTYGFGIQANLLQVFTSGSSADIAFGHGNSTSFTENVRFEGTGNVGIGTTTPQNILDVGVGDADWQYTTVGILVDQGATFVRSGNNAYGTFLTARKARGSIAAPTTTSSGDDILNILAQGYNGTDFLEAARISFEVDGTPGANDMPGAIAFKTTLDGTTTLSTRMTIKNDGNVGIGTDSPDTLLYLKKDNPILRLEETNAGSLWDFNANYGKLYISDGISRYFMTIVNSTGNVGIGTTSPSYRLDIPNSSASHNYGTPTVNIGYDGGIGASEGNIKIGNYQLYVSASDTATYDDAPQALVIHTEDNPNATGFFQLLSVQSAGHANRFSVIHGETGFASQFYDSLAVGTGGYTNCSVFADVVDCGIGGSADLYVADDVEIEDDLFVGDRVGIGTTSPTHKLNVVGGGNFTGDITVSGGDINGPTGSYIDISEENAEGFTFSDNTGVYPDFYCKGSGGTNTYCQFLSGLYVHAGKLITTEEMHARGGISDDGGNLLLNDLVDGYSGFYTSQSYSGTGNAAYLPYGLFIPATAPTTWIYSPNIFLGSTSGSTIQLRGNPMTSTAQITTTSSITGSTQVSSSYFYDTDGLLTYTGETVCWDGSGATTFFDCSSTRKLKKNIENLSLGLDTLMKLQPRVYQWKSNNMTDFGLIAEEVEEVAPGLVKYRNGTIASGIRFENALPALMIKSIQELKAENDLLKSELCKKDNTYSFCQKKASKQAQMYLGNDLSNKETFYRIAEYEESLLEMEEMRLKEEEDVLLPAEEK